MTFPMLYLVPKLIELITAYQEEFELDFPGVKLDYAHELLIFQCFLVPVVMCIKKFV
jgi:hypothetical protein